MESLRSLLRFSPIPIFLYGVASSAIEFANTMVTLDQIRVDVGTSLAERLISARAIVFSFENFFFYTGFAAMVAIAVQYEKGST